MEIWLDGADFSLLQSLRESGLVHGVTTNPSLMAKTHLDQREVITRLLSYQQGPVAVQVRGKQTDEMIEEAKELFELSSRILVKIPAILAGYRAITRLSHARIPCMATAIVEPMQALFAAKAGASYLALYLSSASDDLLDSLPQIVKGINGGCRILGASIHQKASIPPLVGKVNGVTLSSSLLKEVLETPHASARALAKFDQEAPHPLLQPA